MAEEQPGIDRSKSIEDLHHLRLMALLDEQVRDKGARKAAEDLGVDHRTLASSLESGKLTRRMRVALDRALLGRGGLAGEGAEGAQRRVGRAVGRGGGKGGGAGTGVDQGPVRRAGGGPKQLRTEQEQSMRRYRGAAGPGGRPAATLPGSSGASGNAPAGARSPGPGGTFPIW